MEAIVHNIPTFDTTITVLNRIRFQGSGQKQDVWYKTILHHCVWRTNSVQSVQNNGTVNIGSYFTVRVPKQMNFLPYFEWVASPKGHLTFSVGDIIIKGEIKDTDLSPENVKEIFRKYQPEAFYVKGFRNNAGVPFAPHYRIDGAA